MFASSAPREKNPNALGVCCLDPPHSTLFFHLNILMISSTHPCTRSHTHTRTHMCVHVNRYSQQLNLHHVFTHAHAFRHTHEYFLATLSAVSKSIAFAPERANLQICTHTILKCLGILACADSSQPGWRPVKLASDEVVRFADRILARGCHIKKMAGLS